MNREDLKDILAKGKTKTVVKSLLSIKGQLPDDLRNEVIMLASRHEALEKNIRMNLIEREEVNVETAKINHAVLGLLDSLPESVLTGLPMTQLESVATKTEAAGKRSLNPFVLGLVFLLFVAIATRAIGLWEIGGSGDGTSELVIFVHGPKGPQDYLDVQSGEVIVDLGGDRRLAAIGENGKTVFNEIPAKFRGTSLPVSVVAGPYSHAGTIVWDGDPLYVGMSMDAPYGVVEGIIRDAGNGNALPGARVMIDNKFSTVTDDTGRFTYVVPEDSRQERYDIHITAEGYRTKSLYYYPGSSVEFRLEKDN